MMNFPFRKALVTGGAGFIGSHLVERLLGMQVEVVSIDNYVAGTHENLAHVARDPRLSELDVDVLDLEGMRPHFEGVDVVFHGAASRTTVALQTPRVDLDTNAKGTFNVLELAREMGVRKFVHLSTSSVYGEPIYSPQDENHPLNPSTYYGVSKLAGEKYAMAFARLYGMDVTVLRNYHVYGPRQDAGKAGGVVAIFVRKAISGDPITVFGDGAQVRSFTYVDDVLQAMLQVAIRSESRGEIYNCASGARITIRQLAESVTQLGAGSRSPIETGHAMLGEVRGFAPDNSKIRKLGVDFTPFDIGLRKTFEWYREHRVQA